MFKAIIVQALLLATIVGIRAFSFDQNQQKVISGLSTDHSFNISLASLGEDFTRFSHPAFPGRSARIKRINFCDETVKTYSGYIDVGAKHLFFYFFESRSDPSKDDVLFWTNGGPGGSSATALFMELGPCTIVSENETKYNPYSWNSNANVFFIDQPVGTGFSYSDYGEIVSTTENAAQDIVAFVATFFETFSEFQGRGFHLSGESYGGRYLPIYASAIHDYNELIANDKGLTPINLKSVLIGNGVTDFFYLFPSYYEIQCSNKTYGITPFQSISSCVQIRTALPRCTKFYEEACIKHFDLIDCSAAFSFCSEQIRGPFEAIRRNEYDVSKVCDARSKDCYPQQSFFEAYLNRQDVRKTLGIDEAFGNYSQVSWQVNRAFWAAGDPYHQTQHYVAELLERGIRVLIYVGEFDFVCNWIGNERWTLEMPWSGQEGFVNSTLREWLVDGGVAGKTRSYKNFAFATIRGAGHFVPHDKPAESLVMLDRWLSESPL